MKFVDEHSRFENDEMVLTYKFEELYSDQKFMNLMKYNVLAIINRAYLMYEIVGGDITIWVCYTEEEYRKKGYISRLLKQLIKKHKNTKITIDTFNESLRNICKSLGINLFRR